MQGVKVQKSKGIANEQQYQICLLYNEYILYT